MSTANKLQYLIDAKISISAAIEAKGGDVPQELSGYGPAISALPSGGGDLDKLTYVLYEDNKISGHLLEGSISGATTTTPYHAFQNGKVVQLGNAVTEIGNAAFRNVSALTAVTIPNSVSSIRSSTFNGCSGLTSISIPDSVLSIGAIFNLTSNNGNGPFGSTSRTLACYNLVSVELGDSVEIIGNGTFQNCSNLTSINLPDSLIGIGGGGFRYCSSLSSITFPNSLEGIGSMSFRNCDSLSSINVPASVTFIGRSAFANCSSIVSISVDPNNPVFDSRDNCNAIISSATNELAYGCVNTVIPNTVTSIGNNAFNGHTTLASISIPSSVTKIDEFAFQNCSSCMTFDFSSATAVPTLNNVNAFSSTNANKKIIVPDALYDQWKATRNWNSSTNGIVDAITKASEA